MSPSWEVALERLLSSHFKASEVTTLSQKYDAAFSRYYRENHTAQQAIEDVILLETLSDEKSLHVKLMKLTEHANPELHLRLYQWHSPLSLSRVLPVLQHFGITTVSEKLFEIRISAAESFFISDYLIEYPNQNPALIKKIQSDFEAAFIEVIQNRAESDGFNQLILSAELNLREVILIRAYAFYLKQIGFRFTQAVIEKTLNHYTQLAQNLIQYFYLQHNPDNRTKHALAKSINTLEKKILNEINKISVLEDDRILRAYLTLINNTLRTNFFQKDYNNHYKDRLSFKFNSRKIPDMPKPVPLYEIFVYSYELQGIHLRNAKVARGGIRWSDRFEDFRTEILGLMKAQTVKNAVIVPSGAKGGFVIRPQLNTSKEEYIKAGVYGYQKFIKGLLDLTDNLIEHQVTHPENTICHDDDDPYFVVAADKGTATFSDIANQIAISYHYWLGDAFASGGSTGYDHKKIGITARGAWESIKRHFRELSINPLNESVTVVGIGDMSGDVFGNGMIYSNKIKLIAAFDHRHIFIDPNPIPEISHGERSRLFHLSTSSWADYQTSLLSKGGGVYPRTLKSIKLSNEAKKVLGITEDELTPSDLIKSILRAPVDLIFNGGIGTYVKSSGENDIEVGDRFNDETRINGDELRCKVVGEGGNLGFTQRGRIEYALKGGLINTDFIDNSAGVDCSDHEVNLKILLNQAVKLGKLSQNKRDELLASCTNEIAELVLKDNYQQALIMSYTAHHAAKHITLDTSYIRELEAKGTLNRKVEFMPDDKQLNERKAAEIGLTRPEIAILLAYTKIELKHAILNSTLTEDPYLATLISLAFPSKIIKQFADAANLHPLKRDIIATVLSNDIVNEMGTNFIYRIKSESNVPADSIIRAYMIASRIFGIQSLQKEIHALETKLSLKDQYDIFYQLRNLTYLATRWFLNNPHWDNSIETIITLFSSKIEMLCDLIPNLMTGNTKNYLDSLTTQFTQQGLPIILAKRIATYRAIYTSLNIIYVSSNYHFDLINTAEIYFGVGDRFNLVWFRDQIAGDKREGYWNALARLSLRDELDIIQRAITYAVMRDATDKNSTASQCIEAWIKKNPVILSQWEDMLAKLHSSTAIDYSMFFIAIRHLHTMFAHSDINQSQSESHPK